MAPLADNRRKDASAARGRFVAVVGFWRREEEVAAATTLGELPSGEAAMAKAKRHCSAVPAGRVRGGDDAMDQRLASIAWNTSTKRSLWFSIHSITLARSVGARLVETVLEFARAHQVHYATVFTAPTNVAQIMRFYEKQGFAPWGIQFFRQL